MAMLALCYPAVADKKASSELPSLAFLEFLAELEQVDGQWVSPTDVQAEGQIGCVMPGAAQQKLAAGASTKGIDQVTVEAAANDQHAVKKLVVCPPEQPSTKEEQQ